MDSQESISFSIDTTAESIDDAAQLKEKQPASMETINVQGSTRLSLPNEDNLMQSPPSKSPTQANISSPPSASAPPDFHYSNLKRRFINTNVLTKRGKTEKSVVFDTVTVYHFNRSQGFTTVPSQGGSTLGMKKKHFLRRRLSVDLYEEVRRRSRREILLKIRFEKRKREEQLRRELEDCEDRLKDASSSSSSSTTSISSNINLTDDDEDDSSYSDYSDVSDSELESDGYIFLQPIGVKLRRSLLRASGVGRIDPSEKRECNRIRDSRERAGCKCAGQCVPDYCECARLGVNCHVDRVSFPCGCTSVGCRNPLGRTEFDITRVRGHFEETLMKSLSSINSSENDPSNSDSSYEVAIEYEIDGSSRLDEKEELEYGDPQHDLNRQLHEANQSSVGTC